VCEAVGSEADRPDGILVVEASSFQLETVRRFHAHVALLLNVTEDHLDRYPDFEAYARTKMRIFDNQTADDHAVVRTDLLARVREATPARVVAFHPEESADARLEGGDIVLGGERFSTVELPLVGRHNAENVMAALLAARSLGVPPSSAFEAVHTFRPLPHRMERVAEVGGVAYFDDSKATNVGAVARSLEGFPRPVVLIAGGRDKGGSYEPLRLAIRQVARAIVLIGEARERIAQALHGIVPMETASDMDDAVRRASALARSGDAVVLSPACSSYDMFENFEHRGRAFRAAVEALS
jgi:UDP-N-acetylmuramoylalanine--D-glutamate ligase